MESGISDPFDSGRAEAIRRLGDAIARFVLESPPSEALGLADKLARQHPIPVEKERLARLVPTIASDQAVADILRGWGPAGGEAIALGLTAAMAAADAARAVPWLEALGGLPEAGVEPALLTDDLLAEVIRTAQRRLIVTPRTVTGNGKDMKRFLEELVTAARRGVDVRWVREDTGESNHEITITNQSPLVTLAEHISFWGWSGNESERSSHPGVRAVSLLADDHTVLLDSNGHTASSSDRQLILLSRYGPMNRCLVSSFDQLIRKGRLQKIPVQYECYGCGAFSKVYTPITKSWSCPHCDWSGQLAGRPRQVASWAEKSLVAINRSIKQIENRQTSAPISDALAATGKHLLHVRRVINSIPNQHKRENLLKQSGAARTRLDKLRYRLLPYQQPGTGRMSPPTARDRDLHRKIGPVG